MRLTQRGRGGRCGRCRCPTTGGGAGLQAAYQNLIGWALKAPPRSRRTLTPSNLERASSRARIKPASTHHSNDTALLPFHVSPSLVRERYSIRRGSSAAVSAFLCDVARELQRAAQLLLALG